MSYKQNDIAPRYKKRLDPLWNNMDLLRNRSIVNSPNKFLERYATIPTQIENLFEKIPLQLSVPNARKSESARNRLFSFETSENEDLLHSIQIFTFDKDIKLLKTYKQYLLDEVGADKVYITKNTMIIDFFNGLNTYNMVHLIEFITWMGPIDE